MTCPRLPSSCCPSFPGLLLSGNDLKNEAVKVSFMSQIKRAIAKGIGKFGYEIRRRHGNAPAAERGSMGGVLRQLRKAGARFETVIDVGAAAGDFTLECYEVFPSARFILLEPLEEYRQAQEKSLRSIPKRELIFAACDRAGHRHAQRPSGSVRLVVASRRKRRT